MIITPPQKKSGFSKPRNALTVEERLFKAA
jgi:hypothetical protein